MKTIKLQTDVPVEKAPFSIGLDDPVMLIGSCFTENMGKRMQDLGFDVNINPFGIQYNPSSIFHTLKSCLKDSELSSDVLVQHDGLWHSWHHHGSFSRADRQGCLDACNSSIHDAHRFLERCRTIIVTLGSGCCFTYPIMGDQRQYVVANCHKVPQKEFGRMLITADKFLAWHDDLLNEMLFKGFKFVFTVSPVRHQAYGSHGNQLGKAALMLTIEDVFSRYASYDSQLSYFPAYEIMMDELRDYRFYADDLLHPSPLAEEIIWRRFQESYMSVETIAQCELKDKENRRAAHRELHPDTI